MYTVIRDSAVSSFHARRDVIIALMKIFTLLVLLHEIELQRSQQI